MPIGPPSTRRCDAMKATVTTNACVGLPGFGAVKDGPPPWLALLPGLLPTTPSVKDNPQTNPSITPVDTGGHGMPVTGMYFFHPDYQGSISMVTNAEGQYVSGVDVTTGRSHITYHPYGEINRTNSDGPDIFKFKYTGQEEDPETGLMYYKARYYDPALGRFIQPDALTHPDQVAGMNRYAYGANNPVAFTDPDGRIPTAVVVAAVLILGTTAVHGSHAVARGCNALIYGEYTGPGLCGGHGRVAPSGDQGNFVSLFAYHNAEVLEKEDPEKVRQLIILAYFDHNVNLSKEGVTEVDKASRWHDRSTDNYEGGGEWHSAKAYRGNIAWMSRAQSLWKGKLLPIPTDKMAGATRKAATRGVTGNSRGSNNFSPGRSVAIELDYNWRILSEYAATVVGTVLFSAANVVNYVTHSGIDRKVSHNKYVKQANDLSFALRIDPLEVYLYLRINAAVHAHNRKSWSAFSPKHVPISF